MRRPWRVLLAALLLAALWAGFGHPAPAQTVCGRRAEIVARLGAGFGERVRASGLTATGDLVEIFASDKGTWTIIFTKPGGPTCLIAVGDSWQAIAAPALPGRPL